MKTTIIKSDFNSELTLLAQGNRKEDFSGFINFNRVDQLSDNGVPFLRFYDYLRNFFPAPNTPVNRTIDTNGAESLFYAFTEGGSLSFSNVEVKETFTIEGKTFYIGIIPLNVLSVPITVNGVSTFVLFDYKNLLNGYMLNANKLTNEFYASEMISVPNSPNFKTFFLEIKFAKLYLDNYSPFKSELLKLGNVILRRNVSGRIDLTVPDSHQSYFRYSESSVMLDKIDYNKKYKILISYDATKKMLYGAINGRVFKTKTFIVQDFRLMNDPGASSLRGDVYDIKLISDNVSESDAVFLTT